MNRGTCVWTTCQECYVERSGRDLNLRPLGCKSDALTTMPSCHTYYKAYSLNFPLHCREYYTSNCAGCTINNAIFLLTISQDLKKDGISKLVCEMCVVLGRWTSILNMKTSHFSQKVHKNNVKSLQVTNLTNHLCWQMRRVTMRLLHCLRHSVPCYRTVTSLFDWISSQMLQQNKFEAQKLIPER